MNRGRYIRTWTKTHQIRRVIDGCEQCGERITHGTYRREVWIYLHERWGVQFIIRRFHNDPVCGKYMEWEG